MNLPVEQYPPIVPPTIQVTAQYPGADAKTVAATVATPIEQEVNGVENMLYMDSQSTSDGQMRLTIAFKIGTDLDQAQVLVQNRVAIVEPKLPEEVRRIGITTVKNSPDLMLVINLFPRTISMIKLTSAIMLCYRYAIKSAALKGWAISVFLAPVNMLCASGLILT